MKTANQVHQAVPYKLPNDGAKLAFAVCFKNIKRALGCNFTRFIFACGALAVPMRLVDNYHHHLYTAPQSFSRLSIPAGGWCHEVLIRIHGKKNIDQVGQNPWLELNFHLIAWWLRMACIVAEELRRRCLISNSSV